MQSEPRATEGLGNDDVEVAGVKTNAPPRRLSFDGRRGELAALFFRNLLLNLATLAIYRFWATTRVRVFIWRHVKLLGEPLEYLGNGTELLIGFLIAVVFVAPLTALFSWLPWLVPEGVPYSGLLLQALYYGSLGFLVLLAIYRVRRYRLTRTAWRGVRFGLDGSALKYALIGSLYGTVTLATLGFGYPWLRVATTRYFVNNARFGATGFSFEGGALPLFARWLVIIVPALVAVLLFVLVNAEYLANLWRLFPHEDGPDLEPFIGSIIGSEYLERKPLILLLVSPVLYVWYRVAEFRYLINAVRLGGHRLESSLKPGPVYGLYFTFYCCVFVTAFIPVVILGEVVRLRAADDAVLVGLIALFVLVCGYWLYGLCKTLFIKIPLLALACETLSIPEPEVLARAVQSTAALPGHGEGLADALDVGGF